MIGSLEKGVKTKASENAPVRINIIVTNPDNTLMVLQEVDNLVKFGAKKLYKNGELKEPGFLNIGMIWRLAQLAIAILAAVFSIKKGFKNED